MNIFVFSSFLTTNNSNCTNLFLFPRFLRLFVSFVRFVFASFLTTWLGIYQDGLPLRCSSLSMSMITSLRSRFSPESFASRSSLLPMA